MNKKTLLAVIALVLVAAVFAGVYFLTRPETAAGAKEITVTVVHKDGSEKIFTCQTQEEYLGPVLVAENIVVNDQDQYGIYIREADGEKAVYAEDNAYWALYIGEEYATTGADTTPITDGGIYKLVYTGA